VSAWFIVPGRSSPGAGPPRLDPGAPRPATDWAGTGKPYSNDIRNSQLTLGFDVIFLL
jgi:hypothetical protein